MMKRQRIGELDEGEEARVEGVVRSCGKLLRSPLTGRPCVYWDVRSGLGHRPERRESSAFWIEDDSGRILVDTDSLDIDVRARRERELLETVTTDHQALSERLRRLRDRQPYAEGDEAAKIRAERARLAEALTLLLAVRAHAKGKVHLGGKTLEEQARWIQQHAHRHPEAGATIAVVVDRYEVVVAEGDRVVAQGRAARAVDPSGGGYRERATCRALVPPPRGRVRIRSVGTERTSARQPGASEVRRKAGWRLVALVVTVVLLAALWFIARG